MSASNHEVISRAARASLGKYTKSITPPSDRAKIRSLRAERYELLSAARALFLYEGKRQGLEHPQNFHRTAKCSWVTVAGSVDLYVSKEHRRAFYKGLMLCGSVWACPTCAAKVQERRREEIAQAIKWAYEQGLQPVMVTLTFPHYQWNKLEDLIKQQADALQKMRAGAPWKRFKESVGYRGLIRSLELTFSEKNSWHPHTHELWFVDSNVDADEMAVRVTERWKSSCARAGLLDLDNLDQVRAFEAHAVDVKGWCDASDYLAKHDDSKNWGVDREIAKGSTKQGKASGIHPFGLLALAAQGDKKAGARFLEYASVMRGKRQLFWSRGLKALTGVEDKTDEELAEEERDEADFLGGLDLMDWRRIREAGKRAEVLDAAETGGWPAVQAILRSISPVLLPSGDPSVKVSAMVPEPLSAGFSDQPSARLDCETLSEPSLADPPERQLSLVPE